VTRHLTWTHEIASRFDVSLNGEPPEVVGEAVTSGKFGIFSMDSAYAIVSFNGSDCVCIESVEGAGGTDLTRVLVASAVAAGFRCEAWVLNEARARLAARAGMKLTGRRRVGANNVEQLQVST